ncbi:hypothetical protein ACFYYD_11560 [Streptomyces bluensis]|uniref:hypothetical protein n=1 Tax=Streptomyces bluensis TaxID=33897 RepID=UPI00367C03C1
MTQGNIYFIDTLLILYAFMIARSREVAIHTVILIMLGGFILAGTPFGQPIWLLFLAIGDIFF